MGEYIKMCQVSGHQLYVVYSKNCVKLTWKSVFFLICGFLIMFIISYYKFIFSIILSTCFTFGRRMEKVHKNHTITIILLANNFESSARIPFRWIKWSKTDDKIMYLGLYTNTDSLAYGYTCIYCGFLIQMTKQLIPGVEHNFSGLYLWKRSH